MVNHLFSIPYVSCRSVSDNYIKALLFWLLTSICSLATTNKLCDNNLISFESLVGASPGTRILCIKPHKENVEEVVY